MSDFLELLRDVAVPVVLLFVGVIACILGIFVSVDYLDCVGFESGTGIETKWRWGCYAKVEEQWVPKQYAFGQAHELRLKDKRQ